MDEKSAKIDGKMLLTALFGGFDRMGNVIFV
jgi:hypothetical protein